LCFIFSVAAKIDNVVYSEKLKKSNSAKNDYLDTPLSFHRFSMLPFILAKKTG